MPDNAVSPARDTFEIPTDLPVTPEATRTANDERERKIGIILAIILVTFQVSASGAMVFVMLRIPGLFENALREHFAGIVGLLMSTMTAMVVVIIFRVSAGPIEFDTPLGFKFKGASGPVVLWVFTFLACVAGAAALWNLHK
jgi:ABC-type Fe3+-siderophore transport system permease subunit